MKFKLLTVAEFEKWEHKPQVLKSFLWDHPKLGKMRGLANKRQLFYLAAAESDHLNSDDCRSYCHKIGVYLDDAQEDLSRELTPFELSILLGSEFQLKVWRKLLAIPVGQLKNYSEIAQEINHPNASRAVGNAVGQNPICWFNPCHRIVRKDGSLGGFRWGAKVKQRFLEVENKT